ncbi:MAG: hypothetical protein KAY65_02095 [Planctomycetes bacterium]|nr:hypothetical protein [Planctomycetota bacterium]
MTKLQKKAWVELGVVTACVALAGAGVGLMVHLNAKGIVSLMIFLIPGLIAALVSCLRGIANQANFDEREKKIVQKAFILSSYAFATFFCCAAFTVFFIAGGKSSVAVYALPAIFLADLFGAQFIQSAAILIQLAREQADE